MHSQLELPTASSEGFRSEMANLHSAYLLATPVLSL